ncbi:acetyl-hydrolase [Metarhizium album ARSEF 1941]|uniref:Acetyl-hydrolase n=1 Tax=Metarhizium album (strain ARSEF 1941) TaxID=1081103 RepID=A0A0B2WSJ5_METAS|nr:acetyl-hydrolase [Metarhizium album ARSEF 1941]KHN99046.1 acetyl-hydrolase [Metarhizium album ARSEF 1941]
MSEPSAAPEQPRPETPKRPGASALLRLGLSYAPLITRVSLSHALNLADTSPYHNLRNAVTIAFFREFMAPKDGNPHALSKAQRRTVAKLPVKGRIWVSNYTVPTPPEPESVAAALGKVIESLNNPDVPPPKIYLPDVVPVSGEWTGYRAGAKQDEPAPTTSDREKYAEMMKEVKKPTTILYIHGGAHAYLDPASHRPTVKKLAKITGGRAFSVRYRLVPQSPFPASLLDCLVAYLMLLYPPPGSFHEPVKPEHIVISGDSAGGNLTMALIQVIVELDRLGQRIMWHGEERAVPVPAAAACNSPWLDISHSSGPYYGKTPEAFDYLGSIDELGRRGLVPCDIWPARTPRKFLYGADDMMTHPLASPVMRRDWTGFPPVYACTGWERLAYEDKFLAQKLERDGVTVVFEEYEAMPHCFALVLASTAESRRCLDGWAGFIRRAVEDAAGLRSSAVTVHARTLKETPLDFGALFDVSEDEVRRRVVDKVADTKAWLPTEPKL